MTSEAGCSNGCSTSNSNKAEEIMSEFKLTNEQLAEIRDRMMKDLLKGLSVKTAKDASLEMLPTFVCRTPDGSESGAYLALDLGGTNFRVLYVKLPDSPDETLSVESQLYLVPQHLMVGTGNELFDHIAECIDDFLLHHSAEEAVLPLGFTFSFPCTQNGLDQSVLVRWTKGFNIPDVVGCDVAQLLNAAIARRSVTMRQRVTVRAIVNDTVGTMMSCAYEDRECTIGMIVGTGTNACYMEDVTAIDAVSEEDQGGGGRMCVNTEWGGFGEHGALDDVRTECDWSVDRASINPGQMIYEKMISGMYLGEIVRYLLLRLIDAGVLFAGLPLTDQLNTKGRFPSAFVTQIEADQSAELAECDQIVTCLGYPDSSPADRALVRDACRVVSERAAHLCASGVAALAKRSRDIAASGDDDEDDAPFPVTVGVDGTLYKKHQRFQTLLKDKVDQLATGCHVRFRHSYDGSGKGVALVTAASCRTLAHTAG